jgi:SNF2 family DNA or RNA helicase
MNIPIENSPFTYVHPPFDHQRREFESTRDFQYFAHFWEMGLGKSKVSIDTIQWLWIHGRIDSVIITAEKGYYMNWITAEFPAHWPKHLPLRIRRFSVKSVADKKAIDQMLTPIPGTLDILLMNIEGISNVSMKGFDFCKKFLKAHESTMMVVDESTSIKNPAAGKTKNAIHLGTLCTYRRILTGTPITQSPLDIFSQMEFLKKGVLGFNSKTSFNSFYSIRQQVNLGPNRSFMQTVGYRELDDLGRRLQPVSSRLLKKDCLNLPEKVYTTITVDITPEQLEAMTKLREEAVLILGRNLVTIDNALGLLSKAQQIASGHILDDEKKVHRIPSNKIQALIEIIDQIPLDAKVIIWGYFREDMPLIQEALKGKLPVYEVSGGVLQDDRPIVVKQFQSDPGRCVFLASPRVAGKSITLNEASYVIYYSNGYNLEHRLQSEDRNHRIGQTSTVNYYDLVVRGTPDSKVVAALKGKKIISATILQEVKSYFEYEDRD